MVLTAHHTAKHNLWLHSGFWAAWVILFILLHRIEQPDSSLPAGLGLYLIALSVIAIHTYLIAYGLVPLFFFQNRYGWFIAGIIILMAAFSVIELVLIHELMPGGINPSVYPEKDYLDPGNILLNGIENHYIIIIFLSIKTGKAWYVAQATEEEEKQVKLETTVDTYNYQFRPKLISRLMALLTCVLKKDLKKSSEVIVLISAFLTDLLNERENKKITFAKEIQLLKKYFEIFTTALPENMQINFSAEGDFLKYPETDYLLLPVVDYALSLGKWCNNLCTFSILLEGKAKHLHINLYCRNEKKVEQQKSLDAEMFERKLRRLFSGGVVLKEEKGAAFWKLEADVFCQ